MTLAISDTIWAHKARALLIPTPLADLDPGGEVGRIAELCAILDEHGLGIPDWPPGLDALHRRAQQDARGAHLGNDETGAPGTPNRPGLRHPLSGVPLPGRSELNPARWPDLCAHISNCLAHELPARERYRALWRSLMGPDAPLGLAHLPGDPVFNDHPLIAHRSAAAAIVGARLDGHEAALLHLHIGPVQGFIAAARRTQDLWLGSYIVAYLSMQAVAAIADSLGPDAILYPDLSTLPLYGAVAGFGDREKDLSDWLRASLPNRFMALVPAKNAKELAQAAAARVFDTWSEIAEQVRVNLNYPTISADPNFQRQIAAHLEIDATIQAWGSNNTYSEIFKHVRDDLTAQRRLVTDVPPEGSSVAKCTQCGEREQLGPNEAAWRGLRKSLDARFGPTTTERETIDIRDGEALCAVCLTKRFANRWYFGSATNNGSILALDWGNKYTDRLRLRFPSVATVASAPTRHALDQSRIDTTVWHKYLKDCHEHLGFTEPGNLLPGLDGAERTGSMLLDVDGTWFYETSYDADTALRDHDLAKSEPELELIRTGLRNDLPRALNALKSDLHQLGQRARPDPRPSVHITPYYALISLDVDGMGKWLNGTHRDALRRKDLLPPALHREVSRRQSRLATGPLYEIVENDNLGRVVYSGGDDLLAFVPLATLWRCLDALHRRFLADDALGDKVTISAGIAITHWRAPLSQALRLAREAETTAKVKRDRLVVTIDKRSGVPLTYNASWVLTDIVTQAIPAIIDPTNDATGEPTLAAKDTGAQLRLNTLERLARELSMLEACPLDAIRARVFAHITDRRIEDLDLKNNRVLAHIDDLCKAILSESKQSSGARSQPALLNFLHLLRFLAREHDPVIADNLPRPRTR